MSRDCIDQPRSKCSHTPLLNHPSNALYAQSISWPSLRSFPRRKKYPELRDAQFPSSAMQTSYPGCIGAARHTGSLLGTVTIFVGGGDTRRSRGGVLLSRAKCPLTASSRPSTACARRRRCSAVPKAAPGGAGRRSPGLCSPRCQYSCTYMGMGTRMLRRIPGGPLRADMRGGSGASVGSAKLWGRVSER